MIDGQGRGSLAKDHERDCGTGADSWKHKCVGEDEDKTADAADIEEPRRARREKRGRRTAGKKEYERADEHDAGVDDESGRESGPGGEAGVRGSLTGNGDTRTGGGESEEKFQHGGLFSNRQAGRVFEPWAAVATFGGEAAQINGARKVGAPFQSRISKYWPLVLRLSGAQP